MKDIIWVIEGGILGYFENIHHKTLMSITHKRINDPLILNLIKIGLNRKIFEDNYTFHNEIDTSQGEIPSPLLSNIYLHAFDTFMKELSDKYKGPVLPSKRQLNLAYSKLKIKRQTNIVQKK